MSEPDPDPEITIRKAGRPRSAQSHQAILGATLELFAEEGLQGLSIEAIAERAGVGKTTIYRRWSSKEDLIMDAVNMIRSDTQIPDTGNLRNDLLTLARQMLEANQRTPLLVKLLTKFIAEIKTNPEIYRSFYEQMITPRIQQFRQIIKHAQQRGDVRTDLDATLILQLIFGPFIYHILFIEIADPTFYQASSPEQIVDAIMRGIGTQP